jgi:hypothetical protein
MEIALVGLALVLGFGLVLYVLRLKAEEKSHLD